MWSAIGQCPITSEWQIPGHFAVEMDAPPDVRPRLFLPQRLVFVPLSNVLRTCHRSTVDLVITCNSVNYFSQRMVQMDNKNYIYYKIFSAVTPDPATSFTKLSLLSKNARYYIDTITKMLQKHFA